MIIGDRGLGIEHKGPSRPGLLESRYRVTRINAQEGGKAKKIGDAVAAKSSHFRIFGVRRKAASGVCAPAARKGFFSIPVGCLGRRGGGSQSARYVRRDFRRGLKRGAKPGHSAWARNFLVAISKHKLGAALFGIWVLIFSAGKQRERKSNSTRGKMRRTGFEPAPPKRSVP